eukprot:gnl/Trimastix_PCT/3380.p5 GENE.gnl/Trimastix_PCT/3380~~gnl/Trimastix_PCT/3380.p5  ORF type:complete len:131 (-),score=0.92 gnl/Trimastix_PCT/3380:1177-1569(-)
MHTTQSKATRVTHIYTHKVLSNHSHTMPKALCKAVHRTGQFHSHWLIMGVTVPRPQYSAIAAAPSVHLTPERAGKGEVVPFPRNQGDDVIGGARRYHLRDELVLNVRSEFPVFIVTPRIDLAILAQCEAA